MHETARNDAAPGTKRGEAERVLVDRDLALEGDRGDRAPGRVERVSHIEPERSRSSVDRAAQSFVSRSTGERRAMLGNETELHVAPAADRERGDRVIDVGEVV